MIALSWSRLNTYNQCPLKFNLQFITKTFKEEEKSIHLIKGEQLHKQLEDYVTAKNGAAAMPIGFSPEVRETLPYVDKLFTIYDAVYPEAQVATRVDWSPTEWFGKDAAWRAIWDVVGLSKNTCYIGDYKSGKVYPYGDGYGQLHLSAVIALNRFQDVPEVHATYIYIEHRKITPIKVSREPGKTYPDGRPIPHLKEVQDHFEKQFEKVQMEKNWDPTPNEYCKWCPATKMQCKYAKKF